MTTEAAKWQAAVLAAVLLLTVSGCKPATKQPVHAKTTKTATTASVTTDTTAVTTQDTSVDTTTRTTGGKSTTIRKTTRTTTKTTGKINITGGKKTMATVAKKTTKKSTTTTTKKGTTTAAPEPDIWDYAYTVEGTITDWLCDGDYVYALLASPNWLWVFDASDPENGGGIDLPAKPCEIRLIGQEIWISFPSLKQIIRYDADTAEKKSVITLKNEVGSFVANGNMLYYAQEDQWCELYARNLSDATEKQLGSRTYYAPEIMLDTTNGLLYVGETGSTGCAFFAVDTQTGTTKRTFEYQNYGYNNHFRNLEMDSRYVYWAAFRFNRADLQANPTEIKSSSLGSLVEIRQLTDSYIITDCAVLQKSDLKEIVGFGAKMYHALCTQSEYLLMDGRIDGVRYLFILPPDEA